MEMLMMYVIGPAMTIGSSVVAYLQGRKKTTAEVKSNELDNTEKAIAIWRTLAEDVTAQLQAREQKDIEMKFKMDSIHEQNAELMKQNAALIRQNKQLITKVDDLEKDLNEFKKNRN